MFWLADEVCRMAGTGSPRRERDGKENERTRDEDEPCGTEKEKEMGVGGTHANVGWEVEELMMDMEIEGGDVDGCVRAR